MAEHGKGSREGCGVAYRRPQSSETLPVAAKDKLLAIPGVTGFHPSAQDPQHEIVVLVTDESVTAALPDHIDQFRVRAKVSGRIRAL